MVGNETELVFSGFIVEENSRALFWGNFFHDDVGGRYVNMDKGLFQPFLLSQMKLGHQAGSIFHFKSRIL